MPTLGNALDFSKYEGKQFRAHQLGAAPGSPVTGQLFYNTADNTLYWWDGTAWVSARGGAASVPDATTGVKGIVQLAGDLAGTAASPQIAAGVITDAEVAAANKDGAVGTASLRTIGTGAQQAMAGSTTLNNVLLPSSAVDFNGKKAFNVAEPTNPQDAATKAYVDGVAQGLDAKESVKAATTGNITLSGSQSIDGRTCGTPDRVLVKDQTTPSQNGIYVAAAGAWSRAADLDAWAETQGAFVFVENGATNADTGWVCTTPEAGTLGTTAITWSQFSGLGDITSGAGLTKTGNTLDVGAGSGITVNADSVQVANDGITNAMLADGAVNLVGADVTGTLPIAKGGAGGTTAATARAALGVPAKFQTFGPGSTGTTWSVPQSVHLCAASRQNIVQISDGTTGAIELPDIAIAANGDITVTWGASVTSGSKLITVVG